MIKLCLYQVSKAIPAARHMTCLSVSIHVKSRKFKSEREQSAYVFNAWQIEAHLVGLLQTGSHWFFNTWISLILMSYFMDNFSSKQNLKAYRHCTLLPWGLGYSQKGTKFHSILTSHKYSNSMHVSALPGGLMFIGFVVKNSGEQSVRHCNKHCQSGGGGERRSLLQPTHDSFITLT